MVFSKDIAILPTHSSVTPLAQQRLHLSPPSHQSTVSFLLVHSPNCDSLLASIALLLIWYLVILGSILYRAYKIMNSSTLEYNKLKKFTLWLGWGYYILSLTHPTYVELSRMYFWLYFWLRFLNQDYQYMSSCSYLRLEIGHNCFSISGPWNLGYLQL